MTCFASALLAPGGALAYRPFDGDNAAVTDPGMITLEASPAGYRHEGGTRTLVAPAAVVSYGLAADWEASVEGAATHGLSGGGSTVEGTAMSLKNMLRRGSLQGQSGPSLAAATALLLPGVNADGGAGFQLAGVLSQQWRWATVHLNLAGGASRAHCADLFLDGIIEGPHDWLVRPALEIFGEREFGRTDTRSALVGMIWQADDKLAFDVGLRGARVNDHSLTELRAGFTLVFPAR